MTTSPTVHLNGSSRETLIEAYENQYNAVSDCIDRMMVNNVLHARDYYVKGDGEFVKATEEQRARFGDLYRIQSELKDILIDLKRQGRR